MHHGCYDLRRIITCHFMTVCTDSTVYRHNNTAQHATTSDLLPTHHVQVQYSTVQYSTVQQSTTQHSTTQHSTAQHNTAQHSTYYYKQ